MGTVQIFLVFLVVSWGRGQNFKKGCSRICNGEIFSNDAYKSVAGCMQQF